MDKFFVLDKKSFASAFTALKNFGEVFAPVRVSEKSFSFQPVDSPGQIAFEALRTILPPKKFLYPQREVVLECVDDEIRSTLPEVSPFVLFGVHPCDLASLGCLDKIFLSDPGDAHYAARRNKILIAGLSCLPDKHCFCSSVGTDSPSGYDLFFTDIGDSYVVQVANHLGAAALEGVTELQPATAEAMKRFKEFWNHRDELFENRFDATNMPALIDMEHDNPLWKDLGDRCLSCGNCTFVCPTCYCFDLTDIARLNGDVQRQREWDSCQFVGFAKVAGDYNFRPGPVDRLRFWYRHKLHGFEDAYELPTCVGCGRCTVSCPSDIDDIVGVVLKLQGEKVTLSFEKEQEK